MGKNKLKELIIEHKERFLLKEGLIKRDIQEKIRRFFKPREIVLITGVRRSGKSSLMGIEKIGNTNVEIIPLWKWLLRD